MNDSRDAGWLPPAPLTTDPSAPLPPPPPRPTARRHLVLFILTVVSTTFVGGLHYFFFQRGFNAGDVGTLNLGEVGFYLSGFWYSLSILAILGCHEMGHYVACRYYGVDASLPYFLPAPLPLTGTFGAFIRIRSRIPDRKALFDIGLAGPIAGFVVTVPVLFIGLALSRVERLPETFSGHWLGEPLLFQAAAWLVWGELGEGMTINTHPMAFAAWFGLLATALNLFPLGQLDGGHVAYAVLGPRATLVSLATVCVAIGLTLVSSSWIVWTILMVLMLLVIGPRHPPTLDDTTPVGSGRILLAIAGLIMLIVSFTPAPIEPFVTGQ